MAIIHFGEKDYLQTTVVEAGVYPCEISKIDGPKKSGSGKSLNTFVDFTIIDGKYKGKTKTVAFTDGSDSASLLGTMNWMPQAYLLIIAKALKLDDGTVKNFQLDTDELLHKPFDIAWGVATVDGQLINTINSFHPAGYAASAPAF